MTILLVLIAVLAAWFIASYNGLVTKRNRVREAWSDIEVQLKRRHDLIPNLIETVRGYMEHEKSVFENVTKARAQAMSATTARDKLQAESALSSTLKTLFAVSENYPDLKANQNFLELQRELVDTEDKIQAARRFSNGVIMELNTAIESFPTNLIARTFGFAKEEFFDIDASEKAAPQVKF